MSEAGSVVALPPTDGQTDLPGRKGIVLRHLPAGTNRALLVAEISAEKPVCAEVGFAMDPRIEGLADMGIDGPAFIRFDLLQVIPDADAKDILGCLPTEIMALAKAHWQALTLSGTRATENGHLPFALPDIGTEEMVAVLDTMASGWLTTGKKALRFESEFAEFVGSEFALAVNSCTSGLHLALEAVGIGPGDQVITTPFTFTASAEVIRYLGADPLFVDIEPGSFNLDTEKVAAVLARRGHNVKAILPVHFAGQACDMEPLIALGKKHGLKIIEDAAHALPATYKGRTIGTLGDITVFSFYATKTITTGEGGMVTTNDPNIAKRISTMRLHGIDRDVFDRYTSDKPAWYYEVIEPGYKYNMPDLAAAIGIEQLAKANSFLQQRTAIAGKYDQAFGDLPVRTPGQLRKDDIHSWHLYVLQLELENLDIDRDTFIERMAAKGVGTSVHFIPLHLQPYWRDQYQLRPEDFPVAVDVFQRAVSLPIYSSMTDSEVDRVVAAAQGILREARR